MALLTPPPAAPQRGDSTTFSSRVDAFITWLITFVSQMLALVSSLNTLAAGGAYSIPYVVDLSSTADGDPTAGLLRFNSATQNAATTIYLDLLGSDGIDYTSIIDTFDASTNPVKGSIRLVKMGDPTKFLTFSVTARTTATGYRKLTLVNTGGSSASPFAAGDGVVLHFTRAGDKGDPGTLTQVLWVRDEKVSGSAAGDSVAGATVQRTLNTIKRNTITGASLSSNQVTLPAGTYRISFTAPAYCAGAHKAWLYNVTDGAVLLAGTSDYSGGAGSASASSRSGAINCEIVLAASKVLEVRHYTFATSSPGLGFASSSGQAEVYTELFVEKVA
jgi:hypothetical protein